MLGYDSIEGLWLGNEKLTDALGVMKASGVMSLVMFEPEGLRKSAGAGREVILHRSV